MTPKYSISMQIHDQDFLRLVGIAIEREILKSYAADITVKDVYQNEATGAWFVSYTYVQPKPEKKA